MSDQAAMALIYALYALIMIGIISLTIVGIKRRRETKKPVPSTWHAAGEEEGDCVFEIRAVFYLHEYDEEGTELPLLISAAAMQYLYDARDKQEQQ